MGRDDALLVLHVLERVFDGVDGVEEGKVHFAGASVLLDLIDHVVLFRRRVKDNVALAVGEVAPRHVRPYAEVVARDVLHARPHERLPRRDGAFVDRERIVRDDRIHVDFPHDARSVAALARALRIEGELLRAGREEARTACGADELVFRRHVQGRREVVSVRAQVRRKARVHETERVEQFRRGAERGANAGDAGSLPERERGRHVAYVVHLRSLRLRHASAGVGGERFEVAARSLGIDDAKRERRLAASRNARDADDLPERNVDVDVLEVVLLRSAHLYRGWPFFAHVSTFLSCLHHLLP